MRYLPRLIRLLLIASLSSGAAAFAQSTVKPSSVTYTDGVLSLTIPGESGGTYTVNVPITQGQTVIGTPAVTFAAPAAAPPPATGPTIPANATKVVLDPLTWKQEKDAGTPGTACTSALPCSDPYPVAVDAAHATSHEYRMAYSAKAGVRWSVNFANDENATNFVYDTFVYAPNWAQVADLELDINQVTAAGNTRILGTECASQSKTWEYTLNSSATKPGGWHWLASNVACDPTTFASKDANGNPLWHHIQIVGHFDSNDVSTYDGVWVDGVFSAFANASGSTQNPLGWSKGSVLINFQIDGTASGNGSTAVFANQLTIYRW